jgi:hypothetical protein
MMGPMPNAVAVGRGVPGGVAVRVAVDVAVAGCVPGGVAVRVAVDVAVAGCVPGGLAVRVAVGVDVGVDVGVAAGAAQIGPVMVLLSNATWPFCAKTRPFKVAPVFMVMLVSAKTLPRNEVVVSKVAELPILHQTLQGSPPVTDEPGDVMRVDTVLKIQTPEPVRFRFPVKEKLLVEQ